MGVGSKTGPTMSAAAVELGAPAPLERSSRVEEIEEKEVEDLTEIVDNMKIAETAPDPEKVMKHPLQNAWTLWFFKNDKTRTWEENQRPIITVTTVEDFWSLYNHIEVASRLPPGSDYSLFKEGIFPDWEDKRNAPGGRWMINVDKRQRAECLDTYWLEILFFLIGEHADQHAHQVIKSFLVSTGQPFTRFKIKHFSCKSTPSSPVAQCVVGTGWISCEF